MTAAAALLEATKVRKLSKRNKTQKNKTRKKIKQTKTKPKKPINKQKTTPIIKHSNLINLEKER